MLSVCSHPPQESSNPSSQYRWNPRPQRQLPPLDFRTNPQPPRSATHGGRKSSEVRRLAALHSRQQILRHRYAESLRFMPDDLRHRVIAAAEHSEVLEDVLCQIFPDPSLSYGSRCRPRRERILGLAEPFEKAKTLLDQRAWNVGVGGDERDGLFCRT